ncbi:MAG: GAF domain-containing protein [Pseudomonadota bacterium]
MSAVGGARFYVPALPARSASAAVFADELYPLEPCCGEQDVGLAFGVDPWQLAAAAAALVGWPSAQIHVYGARATLPLRTLTLSRTPLAVNTVASLVFTTGRRVAVRDAAHDPRTRDLTDVSRFPPARAVIGLPLLCGTLPIGTLTLVDYEPADVPTPGTLAQLEAVAAAISRSLCDDRCDARVDCSRLCGHPS